METSVEIKDNNIAVTRDGCCIFVQIVKWKISDVFIIT